MSKLKVVIIIVARHCVYKKLNCITTNIEHCTSPLDPLVPKRLWFIYESTKIVLQLLSLFRCETPDFESWVLLASLQWGLYKKHCILGTFSFYSNCFLCLIFSGVVIVRSGGGSGFLWPTVFLRSLLQNKVLEVWRVVYRHQLHGLLQVFSLDSSQWITGQSQHHLAQRN